MLPYNDRAPDATPDKSDSSNGNSTKSPPYRVHDLAVVVLE